MQSRKPLRRQLLRRQIRRNLSARITFSLLRHENSAGTLVAEFGVSVEVVGTVHLEVPAVGTLVEVKGAALGTITATNKQKAKLFASKFEGAKGKQTITKCLEGANEKTHNLLSSTNHGAFEAASENVEGGLIQFENEVEIMDS